MDTKTRLIRALSDGRFHSGESLAGALGISRAAVWKHLHSLDEMLGQSIHSVRGKGYCLSHPIELLDAGQISRSMTTISSRHINTIHIHNAIDSTNTWLMQEGADGAASGTVCLSEQQSAGRGRHGRQWVSPYGSNIYLSLLWRFETGPMGLGGLSLAAGIAIIRTLLELGYQGVGIKWPNDVLWEGRKLAGLLLEVIGEAEGPSQVVIGIGLNTRIGEHGSAIDQPWVDLVSISDEMEIPRNRIAAKLIDNLVDVILTYRCSGLAAFADEWQRHDLLTGKTISLSSASQEYEGRHRGIDETGALLLEIDGKLRRFYAGEVSLRRGGLEEQ
ncbi:MAG: bifunctional biotin--[acetyl-CoA-carboxylase] ligase/biotin operon repressor BirA [gamma proteobacterium endosymbiont of Lamellibrachia anaximandri]|nr:bifunctional biotin--[acetyl-CoA-carboxylase] ligase/biotin operon repressor BirA [gamma proteobacterium endosymbiont of Lamellibrachia anaximandri]MBL3532795.1 bifunctional biotin--[acetyl-CoA-carboxylase] ligase/biotin operon repressor BirA [gamma proteobacterium endosymbiont of Lamellibrachia anaximandri]